MASKPYCRVTHVNHQKVVTVADKEGEIAGHRLVERHAGGRPHQRDVLVPAMPKRRVRWPIRDQTHISYFGGRRGGHTFTFMKRRYGWAAQRVMDTDLPIIASR